MFHSYYCDVSNWPEITFVRLLTHLTDIETAHQP